MKVFAISDLHLSINNPKPMDIFGAAWDNYIDKIIADWEKKVGEKDVVLLPGDFSWAMHLENALPDLELIGKLKGKKVLLRGNHDYWWKSISRVREALPLGMFAVQNDAIRFENECGGVVIAGTRGWLNEEKPSKEDEVIYLREVERLKLSFSAATKIKRLDDKVVCMMHYPPFNARREESPFTKLIAEFKPDAVVYGHLHGKDCRKDFLVKKEGIPYYLTSCDLVGNILTEIIY